MFFDGVRLFSPLGIPRSRGTPADLVNLTRCLSSKWTLISHKCLMKVIEEARKRVKSNATGIGPGSLSAIEKVVHSLEVDTSPSGSGPLRAKSYVSALKQGEKLEGKLAHLILFILPVEGHPLVYWFIRTQLHNACMNECRPPEVTIGSSVTENKL